MKKKIKKKRIKESKYKKMEKLKKTIKVMNCPYRLRIQQKKILMKENRNLDKKKICSFNYLIIRRIPNIIKNNKIKRANNKRKVMKNTYMGVARIIKIIHQKISLKR